MKTHRLYWDDPAMFAFSATVLESAEIQVGCAVVLDRTALYPESGGQPADRGTLGGLEVVDVQERGEAIVHTLAGPAPAVGSQIDGHVDMARRQDHSCQHTAQHILSAIAEKLWDAPTVGFHLGELSSTVDLLIPDPDEDKIRQLEALANKAVTANHRIETALVDPATAPQARIKKEFAPGEQIRLVRIGDLDSCACCGTHMGRTGAIGMIKLGKWEPVRKSARVEFVAGSRALAEFGALCRLTDELSTLTGAGKYELPTYVASAAREIKELKRANSLLAQHLATLEAREFISQGTPFGGGVVVCRDLGERSLGDLKLLATAICASPATIALLGAVDGGRPSLVFARSEDLNLNLSPIFQAAISHLGGKGGGRPNLSQGGGGDPGRLAQSLADALSGVLHPGP